jgi:hypothetical protein
MDQRLHLKDHSPTPARCSIDCKYAFMLGPKSLPELLLRLECESHGIAFDVALESGTLPFVSIGLRVLICYKV